MPYIRRRCITRIAVGPRLLAGAPRGSRSHRRRTRHGAAQPRNAPRCRGASHRRFAARWHGRQRRCHRRPPRDARAARGHDTPHARAGCRVMLKTNLSTRPFYNARLVAPALAGTAIGLAVLSALHLLWALCSPTGNATLSARATDAQGGGGPSCVNDARACGQWSIPRSSKSCRRPPAR